MTRTGKRRQSPGFIRDSGYGEGDEQGPGWGRRRAHVSSTARATGEGAGTPSLPAGLLGCQLGSGEEGGSSTLWRRILTGPTAGRLGAL